jgi:CheY-like chemotaxis protein
MVRINFNRLRFLVIDDNAHVRRIMRSLLHGFGTREVYEAEDGAAGFGPRTISREKPPRSAIPRSSAQPIACAGCSSTRPTCPAFR